VVIASAAEPEWPALSYEQLLGCSFAGTMAAFDTGTVR
jgi:hypothetical protein